MDIYEKNCFYFVKSLLYYKYDEIKKKKKESLIDFQSTIDSIESIQQTRFSFIIIHTFLF